MNSPEQDGLTLHYSGEFVPNKFSVFGTKIVPNTLNLLGTKILTIPAEVVTLMEVFRKSGRGCDDAGY